MTPPVACKVATRLEVLMVPVFLMPRLTVTNSLGSMTPFELQLSAVTVLVSAIGFGALTNLKLPMRVCQETPVEP